MKIQKFWGWGRGGGREDPVCWGIESGCKRRIEVFVKFQKKKIGGGGGGGVVGSGGGGGSGGM